MFDVWSMFFYPQWPNNTKNVKQINNIIVLNHNKVEKLANQFLLLFSSSRSSLILSRLDLFLPTVQTRLQQPLHNRILINSQYNDSIGIETSLDEILRLSLVIWESVEDKSARLERFFIPELLQNLIEYLIRQEFVSLQVRFYTLFFVVQLWKSLFYFG